MYIFLQIRLKLMQYLIASLCVHELVRAHLGIVYVFLKHGELVFQQLQIVLKRRQWQKAQGSQQGM